MAGWVSSIARGWAEVILVMMEEAGKNLRGGSYLH